MSDVYTIELERRVQDLSYKVEHLAAEMTRVSQQVPKSFGSGGGTGGGSGRMESGVATAAIPAGTPAAPSTGGYVQIYRGGVTYGAPVAVTCAHAGSTSVPIGAAVTVAQIDGGWRVVAADC